MEAVRDKARRLGAITSNAQFPFLLGCCCLLMILFVVALVIVMALIPVYLPNNSVARTSNSSTLAQTSIAATTSTSGRKRDASAINSLADCSDCEFGPVGRELIRQKFRKYFQKSKIVSDFQIVSVNLAIQDSGSKKRFALDRSRRQASQYIYVVQFYVLYGTSCFYSCQLDGGSVVQQVLYKIPPSDLTFYNVDMYRNGLQVGYLPMLQSTGIPYVSSIFPGMGPFKPGKGPATRRITTTNAMTTAPTTMATTPAMGG